MLIVDSPFRVFQLYIMSTCEQIIAASKIAHQKKKSKKRKNKAESKKTSDVISDRIPEGLWSGGDLKCVFSK
jgi:hypothetical protein